MPEETIAYRDPNALVQTDWLEAHRGDSNLRIFNCTTHLQPAEPGSDIPYRIVSGKADYDAGHIPARGFSTSRRRLSDNTTKLRFMLPPAEEFAAIMSRHGVGEGARVAPVAANQAWALDFVHDRLLDGEGFRALAVIDEWSRESVAIEVDVSLTGE